MFLSNLFFSCEICTSGGSSTTAGDLAPTTDNPLKSGKLPQSEGYEPSEMTPASPDNPSLLDDNISTTPTELGSSPLDLTTETDDLPKGDKLGEPATLPEALPGILPEGATTDSTPFTPLLGDTTPGLGNFSDDQTVDWTDNDIITWTDIGIEFENASTYSLDNNGTETSTTKIDDKFEQVSESVSAFFNFEEDKQVAETEGTNFSLQEEQTVETSSTSTNSKEIQRTELSSTTSMSTEKQEVKSSSTTSSYKEEQEAVLSSTSSYFKEKLYVESSSSPSGVKEGKEATSSTKQSTIQSTMTSKNITSLKENEGTNLSSTIPSVNKKQDAESLTLNSSFKEGQQQTGQNRSVSSNFTTGNKAEEEGKIKTTPSSLRKMQAIESKSSNYTANEDQKDIGQTATKKADSSNHSFAHFQETNVASTNGEDQMSEYKSEQQNYETASIKTTCSGKTR